MKLSREQYIAILRKPAIAKRNQAGGSPSDAVVKPHVEHEQVGADKGEVAHSIRHLVSYEFRVCRLLDEDNLAGATKWPTDWLRRSGLIRDDCPAAVKIQFSQTKVKTKAEEMTVITIEEIK